MERDDYKKTGLDEISDEELKSSSIKETASFALKKFWPKITVII